MPVENYGKKHGEVKKETACWQKLEQAIVLAKMIHHSVLVEFFQKYYKELYGEYS